MKTPILFAVALGFLFTGCNSVEQIAATQKSALQQLVAAIPAGMREDAARAAIGRQGWKITSDNSRDWPSSGSKSDIDKVLTVSLPSRPGIPFRNLVFGYVGVKDGKVVCHEVVVEPNAL